MVPLVVGGVIFFVIRLNWVAYSKAMERCAKAFVSTDRAFASVGGSEAVA